MLDGPRFPIASCGTASTFVLINIGFGGGGGVPSHATLEFFGRGWTDEKKKIVNGFRFASDDVLGRLLFVFAKTKNCSL